MQAYRLLFHDPLQVAPGAAARVSSVTLSGALLWAYAQLHPYADMDKVAAAPPFAVSDALLCRSNRAGGVDHFFPTPLSSSVRGRFEFLDRALFERVAGGAALPPKKEVRSLDGGRVATAVEEGLPPLRRHRRRLLSSEDGGAREVEEIVFAPGAGLYFVAHFEARDVQRRFEGALRLLGDAGLGPGRGTGRGRFFPVADGVFTAPAPLAQSERSMGRMLLGSWVPSDSELQAAPFADGACYQLQWARHPSSTDRLCMVEPGSVLCLDGEAPVGSTVPLAPRHESVEAPPLRFGRTLTVGACLA